MKRRPSILGISLLIAASAVACASEETAGNESSAAVTQAGTLVPETAPTRAIVLANADLFAGINELHYTLLRGLFSEPTLADVKVVYLTPHEFPDMVTPVRARDGDRLTARFSTRFSGEIASGRLTRVNAAVGSNWARDYFPMVLQRRDGSGAAPAVHFDYAVVPETGPVAGEAARTLGYDVAHESLQIEGGNVMIDDEGTLFTTTKVLERNRPKSKTAVEAALKGALGARAIEWLEPLPGESTGHVDIVAKVVGPKQVLVGASDGVCGEDAPETCAKRKPALDGVAAAFERRGYRVTRVVNAESEGDRRALTYANSLIVNKTAFVPMYFDPSTADDLVSLSEPGIPARQIVKDCNTANPFPGTTDLAADLVARERARCALDRYVTAARAVGESTGYYDYQLQIAKRDLDAKRAYEELGFRVVQVPGASMINFGGSVHCVTMQLPK